jgi:5-methylcytosine-specific restriction protein A
MTMRAPRVCSCGTLVAHGVMCVCQLERQAASKARFDAQRPTASQRGYDTKWQKERKAFLAKPENRLCGCGCGRAADMVDHIIPHRGDLKLFWRRSNWQPLASSPCHSSRKQAQERAVFPVLARMRTEQ